ncbi:P-loop containing nucleoside triphosphate hydrolase [Sesbania bispinosa]|nr:P-loop containing nucleoside triphosphate hydrolase [Sesbania bispinosa]
MQAQNVRTGVEIREFHAEFRNVVLRNERIELRSVCSPPEPPVFTVGLDVSLNELNERLLRDPVSVSVLTVTGSGGSRKSTLVKCCFDM